MTAQRVSTEAGFEHNPGPDLERFYTGIVPDMTDLPVFNERLTVEAVGFCQWEGHWLGVLITPWFMNLLVVPRVGSPWPELQTGKAHRLTLSFPAGDYTFVPRHEDALGTYLCCSLMSPVHDLPDQASARRLATEVMDLLNRIPVQAADAVADDATACPSASTCSVADASGAGLSRRQLFGG